MQSSLAASTWLEKDYTSLTNKKTVFTKEEQFWSETAQLLLEELPELPLHVLVEYHTIGVVIGSHITMFELYRLLKSRKQRYAGALETGELVVNHVLCAKTLSGGV